MSVQGQCHGRTLKTFTQYKLPPCNSGLKQARKLNYTRMSGTSRHKDRQKYNL